MNNEFVLEHPRGIIISRDLSESEVHRLEGTKKNDMSTGYVWYSLPLSAINGSSVAISLCFHQGVIDSLNMALVDPTLYGGSWSDWTEDKERLRAQHTEDWLRTIGYTPGTFAWGEIWAGYDVKGGNGHAGVRYFALSR